MNGSDEHLTELKPGVAMKVEVIPGLPFPIKIYL
jgi:hypothetical protein